MVDTIVGGEGSGDVNPAHTAGDLSPLGGQITEKMDNLLFPNEPKEPKVKATPKVEKIVTSPDPVESNNPAKEEEEVVPEVDPSVEGAKFKFEGKEYTEKDLTDLVSKWKHNEKTSHERFQEAYKLKMQDLGEVNQAKTLLKAYQDNPKEFLQDYISKNPNAKAEFVNMLDQLIQYETMDPAEKALQEREAKVKSFEEQEQQKQAQFKAQQDEKEVEGKMRSYASAIDKALIDSKLITNDAKDRTQLRTMVNYYVGLQLEQGIPTQPSDVIPLVIRDLRLLHKAVSSTLPDDEMDKYVDDNFLNRVRALDKSRAKSSYQQKDGKADPKKMPKKTTRSKEESQKDYLDRIFFSGGR